MPNYRYQIRNASGQIQVGVLSADTVGSAATVLRNQGRTCSPLRRSRAAGCATAT